MKTKAMVQRPLERIVVRLRQRWCRHVFTLHDLHKVPGADHSNRVAWRCMKCDKRFRAHCGLDISPENGPTVQFDQPYNGQGNRTNPRSG